ncbi:glycosyltransferase family 4 protein [Negadavirga shengliensis]|uniref:Glycosyltransferase family 4 protein n=1 Tax=Negadavirga shengliensis TaxID=1389218 RepID=A0ABV9SXK0_9BACT
MDQQKKNILVDVFYLHVAQTGIKTYMELVCGEIENYSGKDFRFVVVPHKNRVLNSSFFKGKTSKWRNWLFQLLYFGHKLLWMPICSVWHKADLVFSPDILSPVWAKGIKVSVIHDAFFWETPAHYHPLWRKIYLSVLGISIRKKARILTVSNHSKSRIKHFLGENCPPIDVVHSGVAFGEYKPDNKLPAPIERPYFLHVGVMEKRKNLVALVKAFGIFLEAAKKDFCLVLVGQRGPRETLDDYDAIVAAIHRHDLHDAVFLPGYVDKQTLNRYYQNAFAYVFPSLNEGFGLPVLEAFSYHLPVIVSDQDALKEIGGDAVYVCEDNSKEGIAKALTVMALDEGLRKRLITAGGSRLKAFSRKKFFISLLDYFKKTLDG